MRCPTCKSSNKIQINDKHYCTDCGSSVTTQQPVSQPQKPEPLIETQAAAADQKSPEATGRVLDLSPQPNTESGGAAQSRPQAQSIHGARQPGAPTQKTHQQSAEAQLKPPQRTQDRRQRAAKIPRSPQIQKFPTHLRTAMTDISKQKPEPLPEPKVLDPRATYMVNRKAAQADAAATIAMHHQRFGQTQASGQLKAETPPRPTVEKTGLFERLAGLFKFTPRFAMATSIALSVVVLGGYITYLNYPSLSLRIAASRAGVDASLPGYTPSGYSFKGIEHDSGQLTIKFTSNSDAGFINISQSSTGWDSESLLEGYVLNRSRNYQTFQERGLTIYMFGGNNAAWVNRGTFYSIMGNNYLNHEQILRIATSL